MADHAASGRLTIDLEAIQTNWRALNARTGASETGAVVKANAYGLGVAEVSLALWRAGARRFYVAQTTEGAALRRRLPEADIVVMAPIFPEALAAARASRLILALNDPLSLAQWRKDAVVHGDLAPACLHIDTGMTRLGFDDAMLPGLWSDLTPNERAAVVEVSSHLACADIPDHPANRAQLRRFQAATKPLPAALRLSLANSSGIFIGQDYHFSCQRPGMALYGLNPLPSKPNPMQAVVMLEARILQVRTLAHAETVGYGATAAAPTGAKIATIAAGYADGLHRCLSENGVVFIGGRKAPILGRVSMDLTAVDVTDVSDRILEKAQYAEIIGPRQTADNLAARAGTIGYEILTSLGDRYLRRYEGAAL